MALRKPDASKDLHKEEVGMLIALFHDFVVSLADHEGEWESLADLMAARADIAIRRACAGFNIDFDEAIDLIRNTDDLDNELTVKRNILLAAVDNLVDFAVAEEYHMAEEMAELEEELEDEEEAEDLYDMLLPIFSKFNDRYMLAENQDIEYALIMAEYLSKLQEDTTLMYMTQGDERVRPWHLQFEGFTAPKSSFPAWLIPPIEHQCRCYLVEDSLTKIGAVQNAIDPQMPEWFNRTFKESVALGGRIFSDEHPYFQVDERHVKRLSKIAKQIKAKYLQYE